MRKTVIILGVLAAIVGGCGKVKNKQAEVNGTTTQIAFSSEGDTLYSQAAADNYTVEDTVRYQIGGELYYLDFRPSDSITAIKTMHGQFEEWGVYREYHFIVHSHYSNAHSDFEPSTLDTIYDFYRRYYRDDYEIAIQKLDSIQSKHIDSSIKDFNDYWIYLKEYNGNYYLDDDWAWHSSFYIADSVLTYHYMDGLYPKKILEAVSLQGNGISILLDGDNEPVKIEVFNKTKSIYRFFDKGNTYFIAPARAIHNFEIIQYTNNTGDCIFS
jgi:hypothetical protein